MKETTIHTELIKVTVSINGNANYLSETDIILIKQKH